MDHPLVELLAVLVRPLVSQPEAVGVRLEEDELLLEVAPADRGRVIGRQGRTVDALQVLLDEAAHKRGLEPCTIEVLE